MRLILLTGLDGSGKSTLLNKIEEESKGKSIGFIRVPKIDTELFKHNKDIYNATVFINKMHSDADELKLPQLKVVALFSSMLIFKELLNELKKNKVETIFCERHPLIDTGVYAKFYSGKMDPKSLSADLIKEMDKSYVNEIFYLFRLINGDKAIHPSVFSYLEFIHTWFSIDQKHELADLKKIFPINLPDKIIYLSATPEILMTRLSDRKILEAHESSEVFRRLIPVYEKTLNDAAVPTEKIDANSFSNLDKVFEKIKTNYF